MPSYYSISVCNMLVCRNCYNDPFNYLRNEPEVCNMYLMSLQMTFLLQRIVQFVSLYRYYSEVVTHLLCCKVLTY